MFFTTPKHKLQIPDRKDALPGRVEAIRINPIHHALGTRIVEPFPDGTEKALFGLGCFWGAERVFWRTRGVFATAVGYAGGLTPNPTYEEVCSGLTGHNEVVLVIFDPAKISYSELVKVFFEAHNPTQGMRQGNDVGTQYRSALYWTTPGQEQTAREMVGAYNAELAAAGHRASVTTELAPRPDVYLAEGYHQQYLARPGSRPYCSARPSGVLLDGFEGANYKLPASVWSHYDWTIDHCVLRGDNAPIAS